MAPLTVTVIREPANRNCDVKARKHQALGIVEPMAPGLTWWRLTDAVSHTDGCTDAELEFVAETSGSKSG